MATEEGAAASFRQRGGRREEARQQAFLLGHGRGQRGQVHLRVVERAGDSHAGKKNSATMSGMSHRPHGVTRETAQDTGRVAAAAARPAPRGSRRARRSDEASALERNLSPLRHSCGMSLWATTSWSAVA